jgi:hypothetical protein
VGILALKLTLTPAVIAGATLAARRFGPSIGGWLIGLPVTAGPVLLVLALEHGARFADHVAVGLVAGVAAQAAFVLGYAGACRRGGGRRAALATATAAFAATGSLLVLPHLRFGTVAACSLALLAVGLLLLPPDAVRLSSARPRHDLPLRIALATSLLLLVTTFATTLGAGLSGVVTVYPLLSTLLAVFAHRSDGPRAALAVFRGLLVGLFALMAFATTLVLVLTRLPLGDAYALAIALTLAIQVASLRAIKAPLVGADRPGAAA